MTISMVKKKGLGKMKQYLDRKGFSNFPFQGKQMTKMRIKRMERDDDFLMFSFPFPILYVAKNKCNSRSRFVSPNMGKKTFFITRPFISFTLQKD